MKTRQRHLTVWTLLSALMIFPMLGFAQNDRAVQGYLFGSVGKAIGSSGKKIGGGIGFERLWERGVGIGAELQGFGVPRESYGGIIFSANGSYHLRKAVRAGKIAPFGTAGYSGLVACSFGCGSVSGFNFGGGVNYWFKPNRGLRFEVRDHVFSDFARYHMWEFRTGFSF